MKPEVGQPVLYEYDGDAYSEGEVTQVLTQGGDGLWFVEVDNVAKIWIDWSEVDDAWIEVTDEEEEEEQTDA